MEVIAIKYQAYKVLRLTVLLLMVYYTACSATEPAAAGNGQTSPDVPAENMTGESTKEMAETVTVSGAETESANENSIKTVTVYYPDSVCALGDAVSYIN